MITSPSAYKDEGWDLISFILGEEGQTIIANGGRMCGAPDNIANIWGEIASGVYGFENTDAFAKHDARELDLGHLW